MSVGEANPEKIIENLQAVLTRYVDSSKGYREAADAVEGEGLAGILNEIAIGRSDHSVEIAACIEALGEEADSRGSVEAKVHRWWIDLRDRISPRDDTAILNECVRGDEELLRTLREAHEDDCGVPAYRSALGIALSNVEATLERLRALGADA